jgi:hypothetical protein
MPSSPDRYVVLLLLGAAATLPLRAEETPSTTQPAAVKTGENQKKSAPAVQDKETFERKQVDLSSLPAEAVIVICERAGEALDLLPKAVILRPDKYQELLDQIAKLKKQLENPKSETAVPPTRCLLRGQVEAGVVRLEAEFAGIVERANTLVSLACPQAGVSSAETDGRLAQLRRSKTGGFLVRIDKTGEYHVKLHLFVPLSGREGNHRGFELTLPRAVLTHLDLQLPANCTDVRVGGQLLKDLQLPGLELKNRHLRGNPGLGPVDKLELSWKEARPLVGEPVRTAEGHIQARLDAAGLTTLADLVLTAEGAATKVWRLLVPRNAEVKVLPSDKEVRVAHHIDTDDQKYPFASLRTIHLKEARSDPLHVQIKLPLLPLPPRGGTMAIGPFFVLDAAQQTGTVQVRNLVRNLHLEYRGRGDMQLRRQETEETKGEAPATVATLTYSNIPLIEKPEGGGGPRSHAWLELEAIRVPAQIRMRVVHTLTLATTSAGGAPKRETDAPQSKAAALPWAILTTITPATKWADVEQLKIFVPPEWEPTYDNVSVVPNSNPRCVTIPAALLREAPAQTLRLEGRYKARYKAEEHALLKLPQPEGTIEACEVKLEAPADAEVVVANAEQVNLELSKQPWPNEQRWRCRSVPANGLAIEVSWRPYRPELRAAAVVDLTLNGARGDVRHELRFQLPATPPPFVTLRVPAAIRDTLQIRDAQEQEVRPLTSEWRTSKSEALSSPAAFAYRLPVPTKEGGKEWRLTLRYTTRLDVKERAPHAAAPFAVPLATLDQATAGDLKVRIWSEPGLWPRAASPLWEEQNIEEIPDRPLPVLVLRATTLDAPLRLVWVKQAAGASALVERALMRVQLEESGAQNWHAHFQLLYIADGTLDLLMPAPVAALNAQFHFNGRQVTPVFVNENGEISSSGAIARLHLPPSSSFSEPRGNPTEKRQTALLEVSFQLPPGLGGASLLHTALPPPRIRRAAAAPTCWQVSLPANRVLLAPESASGVEHIWRRRGWLLVSSLSVPPELQQDKEPVALLCWQDQNAPMVLTHVPQLAWQLVCSLGLLLVTLGLGWLVWPHANERRRRTAWFWPLLALAMLAIAVTALFRPTLLCALVYGCEPGIVVLSALLGVQWLRHQRYRRQIVFLPSFSRSRAGSSLTRKSSSHRLQSGEPSTVDAPPPSMG